MSYQRDSFPPLPTALITCIILLITLPFLFFYQKSFSKNIIFKKDIKVVVHSISNSTQVKKYINNLPDYAARLPVRGFAPEIGISPQEEVWFATKAGNTYFTKAVGELWHFGPFGSKDEFASNSGETYERVNFFSDDTLMISGFIQGENSVADFVYWSGNHGKTWKKIKFGESSWIDAAFVNNKGKAWMSGSSQFIYYSKDNGQTWEQKSQVEPNTNLRFSTIHFAHDEQTGLFGSHWNVIYLTKDNCKTWTKLPTPLSQGKYQKLSSMQQPDIRKARILDNYYLVNQEGKVFYSSREKIDWQLMPHVIDFEVTETGLVYLVNKDLTISFLDSNLTPVWRSAYKLDETPIAIAVRNNNLFVKTFDFIYKINKGEFTASGMLTTEVPIQEPYLKVKFKGQEIGFDQKDVLRYNKKKNYWYRTQTLPIAVGSAIVFKGDFLITDYALNNRYTFNPATTIIKKYELPLTTLDLPANTIKLITIEQGSQGCDHHEKFSKTYVRKGDVFILKQSNKLKELFKKTPSIILASTINQLYSSISTASHQLLQLTDLQITQKDIEAYKKLITEKEKQIKINSLNNFSRDDYFNFPGEKTDFDFYRAVADSLSSIPDSVIHKVFNTGSGNFSTTTNWIKLTFEFQNGQKLIISNQDDKPNYLHTPWIVNFEGLLFKTNSLNLGRQINLITGGEFFEPTAKDKKYALYQIATYLYRQSIERPYKSGNLVH